MKKLFDLNDDDLRNMYVLKSRLDLKTDVAIVRYALDYLVNLVEQEEREQQMVNNIVNMLLAKMGESNNIVKRSVRETEKNTAMILDAVNTFLIQNKLDICIPVDTFKSSVLEQSEEIYKSKISNRKQKKDFRNG